MGKDTGKANVDTAPQAPPEVLPLGVWAQEVGLDPVRLAVLKALHGGERHTREEWQGLLERALNRPAPAR